MIFAGINLAGSVASAAASATAIGVLQTEVSALQLAVGINGLENSVEDSQIALLRNKTNFVSSNRTYLGTNDMTNPLLNSTDPPETNINSSLSVGSILKVSKSSNEILHTVPTTLKVNDVILLQTSVNKIELNKSITFNGKGSTLNHYYNADENSVLSDATISVKKNTFSAFLTKSLNDGEISINARFINLGDENTIVRITGDLVLTNQAIHNNRTIPRGRN